MARAISPHFMEALSSDTGSLNGLLKYIQSDDTLEMGLRGDRIIIYYRGGALLTVLEKSYVFLPFDAKYDIRKTFSIEPSIKNIEEYIPRAKHIMDVYISSPDTSNHLGEKEIQQLIVKENNYSANSLDTDYFIIDMEYQDKECRFDLVALRWDSTSTSRKSPRSNLPTITVFEVKQGYKSIAGASGINKHKEDFEKTFNPASATFNAAKVDNFKKDMIQVFQQKRMLGLIRGLEKHTEIEDVSDSVELVFLLANYKSASKQLTQALESMEDCSFIYSNPMGYGLYANHIIDQSTFKKLFL